MIPIVPQSDKDKLGVWNKYRFVVMFDGDGWKGAEKWNNIEEEMRGGWCSSNTIPLYEGDVKHFDL